MVRTHAAEVSNADMESHSCTTLIATSQVVGKPTNNAGERWVDPASREKDAAVDYARVLSRVHRNTPVKVKVVSILSLDGLWKKRRGADAAHIANPTSITVKNPRMNGLRFPALSER